MSKNKKKLLIISGVTGIGKSKIAYNLSKRLNSEIILLDIIQTYKQLNICSNKPSIYYLNSQSYHNHNLFDLDDLVYNPNNTKIISNKNKPNATHLSSISRKISLDIFNRNKIPIIEGGSVFYIKNFLGGEKFRSSENEDIIFDKIFKITQIMIDKDENNIKTYNRIKLLVKRNLILDGLEDNLKEKLLSEKLNFHYNDVYRLKKRFAEEIFHYLKNSKQEMFLNIFSKDINKTDTDIHTNQSDFPENANYNESDYIFKELMESKNIEVYQFFFSTDKKTMVKIQEERCVNMIESGLINEVKYLIKKNLINENNIEKRTEINGFVNAFGVKDSLEFLINLMKSDIWRNGNNDNFKYDKKSVDELLSIKSKTKIIYNLIYNYLKTFSVKNRQYSRKQIQYFKNDSEKICWMYLNNLNSKISNMSNFNNVNMDEEKLINELIVILNTPYEQYKEFLKNEFNKQNFRKISTFNNDFKNYLPRFNCLEIKDGLLKNVFVRNLLYDAVSCINENKEKLENLFKIKNNNLNRNYENNNEEMKALSNIDENILETDIKEILQEINFVTNPL